jgi:phage terminase large subunit-like protein
VIAFLEGLTITSGAYAGQKLRLRPWQRTALGEIFRTDADGKRVVRTALLSLGRKSGKSTISSGIALAFLAGPEAVQRGQIVVSAADRNQGAIIFNEVKAFALADPEIADRLLFREWNKTIEDTVTGSTLVTASSDHRKAHGTSPLVWLADEVSQWRGRELLDALQTGQGAHAEPLGIILSTRSPDPDNPLEELIRYGQQIREGVIEDPTFASFVWSAPQEADPWSPATWALANPDADPARLADIAVQAVRAQRVPSQESAFRAYVLNQPTRPDDRWLHAQDWDACAGEGEARGPCFAALDLSSGASDLTAWAMYWPETGCLKVTAFIPEADLQRKMEQDRAPYREWVNRRLVVPIPGRAIDRTWLVNWIAQAVDGLELAAIAHDRWGLRDLQAVLDREGISLPLKEHGQGYRDMSPSINALEAAVLKGTLRHGGNPLLRWAVGNAVVDTDPAGNRKLTKARAHGRIDPLIAAVMAMGLAAREPPAPIFAFTGMMVG